MDYSFNTRGWLTGINNTGANMATSTDLFAFKIYYNTSSETGTQKLYNGNICETHWKSKTDNVLRKYTYTFDDLNRLNKAGFKSTGADGRYNEDILYDKGGNITALQRTGRKTNATYGIIDLLSYHYAPYSNQLMKVTDSALDIEGFSNVATAGNEDYAYDDNGNMVKDFNKGLGTTTADGITYNYMNLPTLVKVDNDHKIEYVYDAIGTKMQKKLGLGLLPQHNTWAALYMRTA